jgi:hypothetical protein
VALLVIAAWAISLTGCGNDAGTSSAASDVKQGPLSNAALAAKADAICERLKGALNAADTEAGFSTLRQRAKLSELFAAAEEKASNRLASLEAQPSEEAEWQRISAARRALVPYHHRITKYALQGNQAKTEEAYRAYRKAQARMKEAFEHTHFPFKICWDIG